MEKLLLTGASSFIGRNLSAVMRKNWDITAVIRQRSHADSSLDGLRVLRLDMEDYARLGELSGPCDCFVHLAWNGTRGKERMDADRQQANLENSLQGIRSVLQTGCRRVVLAGSQAEYGPHKAEIREDTPCIPNTEYGKAKLELYQKTAALCMQAGAAYMEPRFFSLYGPGDCPNTMIMGMLKHMLTGESCELTQGLQMWDFLYIDDAVEALAKLCEGAYANGVYNFGSGDVRTLREYVLEMAEVTETKSKLSFGAVPYPTTGMVSLWPNISRLKRELDWAPHTPFSEGLRSIIHTLNTGELS